MHSGKLVAAMQVIDSLREMLGPVQGPATDSASTGVIFPNGTANIIPVDANSIAYGRTVEEVKIARISRINFHNITAQGKVWHKDF